MDFKSQINSLMNGKGLNTNSIKLYIRNLERLNDNKPLKNLNFLNKYDDIEKKLEKYKDNTKRNFYVSIVSALNLLKDKHKGLNKSYKYYYDKMNEITKEIKAIPSTQKSEQQEKNWIKWSEVEDKYKLLKDKIQPSKKVLSSEEFDDLLDTVLMGLYVLTPVRRNQDYMSMYIVKSLDNTGDIDKNYFDIDNKRFIFNKYKTAKKYGSQTIDIPQELYDLLMLYIKHHPLIKGKINKKSIVPLLVDSTGKHLSQVNSITRRLNKIFGRNVGSSMLRHIYLSDKYDDVLNEQKKDAMAMAHSITQQREYIKLDDNDDENIKMTIDKEAPSSPKKRQRKIKKQ